MFKRKHLPLQPQIRNAVDTVYKMSQKEYKRGVAQPGSAPGLGPGGRRFESCRPDLFLVHLYIVFTGCSAAR